MSAPGDHARKVDNLYYAGAFTAPRVGLPMCLISAENAIAALARDLGQQTPENLVGGQEVADRGA